MSSSSLGPKYKMRCLQWKYENINKTQDEIKQTVSQEKPRGLDLINPKMNKFTIRWKFTD